MQHMITAPITANQAHVLCMLIEMIDGSTPGLDPADIEDAWIAHATLRAVVPISTEESSVPAETRLYVVRPKDASKPPRLIDCGHPQTARGFVAADTLDVHVATPKEVAELCGSGIKVEKIMGEQLRLPANQT